ncbi:hypothetical protein ACFFUR_13890 [Echinicola jeungdonensis]|uniref:Uncharacterized protein n=2 Tax=Echinicola jeungdonensis TaxID=709343 RepID=A0ABV5J8T3_9BACT
MDLKIAILLREKSWKNYLNFLIFNLKKILIIEKYFKEYVIENNSIKSANSKNYFTQAETAILISFGIPGD